MATEIDEYEVLYDWDGEREEDLTLFSGETIHILEKNEHGWWLGVIFRENKPFKGYFPKNYVKALNKDAPSPPPRPPRPNGLIKEESQVEEVTESLNRASVNRASTRRGPTFSLKSLIAFDSLAQKGYAIEHIVKVDPQEPKPLGPELYIEMDCTAFIWDGAMTEKVEYATGKVSFVTGQKSVLPGIEIAAFELNVGETANVTCSPRFAYGAAGCPPVVPPNSFIVLQITLLTASLPSITSSLTPQGPEEFLTSGIVYIRNSTNPPSAKLEANSENSQLYDNTFES